MFENSQKNGFSTKKKMHTLKNKNSVDTATIDNFS